MAARSRNRRNRHAGSASKNRKVFPGATERPIAFGAELDDLETPALGWLFPACGLVLSLDDAGLASGGVKVDTVVVDGRRLLRSLMSYRIADALARLLRAQTADVVVCAGDLLTENAVLRSRIRSGVVRSRLPVLFAEASASVR